MTSRAEDALHELLLGIFPAHEIERQALVMGKRIDFFIRSMQLYIQVDGVYWHGVGHDPIALSASGRRRDLKRANQVIADRRQNEMFKRDGLTLVRVTDAWVKRATHDDVRQVLSEKRGDIDV